MFLKKVGDKVVREFNLINEKGQTFSLMDIKNYCLLTEPAWRSGADAAADRRTRRRQCRRHR